MKVISENVFVGSISFHMLIAFLKVSLRKKKDKYLQEYLVPSLYFVCQLEGLKNDIGSCHLSSSHSESLLIWGVFSIISFCLIFNDSVYADFLHFQVLILKMKCIYQNMHREMQQWIWLKTTQLIGKGFFGWPVWSELRLRGSALLLRKCLNFFSLLQTYFINMSFWV